ncbi:unnamed protein product [Owenia fusiformis]|uniref:SMB domain-containing protein n=1 Tax=Owenia fusiformis TaxID=6347 RepID=A0A8S4Q561_OWEFU|nr:unnamed protein product [Owenia fusiformis]
MGDVDPSTVKMGDVTPSTTIKMRDVTPTKIKMRDVAPSTTIKMRDVTPTNIKMGDVAPSTTIKMRDVTPTKIKMGDVAPSTTIKMGDVTPSTPIKMRDVTPSTPIKMRDVTPSTPIKMRDVTPSTPIKMGDTDPSTTIKMGDLTPSTLVKMEGTPPENILEKVDETAEIQDDMINMTPPSMAEIMIEFRDGISSPICPPEPRSCKNRCSEAPLQKLTEFFCQCDDYCVLYKDCCHDYSKFCLPPGDSDDSRKVEDSTEAAMVSAPDSHNEQYTGIISQMKANNSTESVHGKLSELPMHPSTSGDELGQKIPDSHSGPKMLDPPIEQIPDQLLGSKMPDPPLEEIPDQVFGSEMLDTPLEQIPDQLLGSKMLDQPLEQIPDHFSGSKMLDTPSEQIPDQLLRSEMLDPPIEQIPDQLFGSKMLDSPSEQIPDQLLRSEMLDPPLEQIPDHFSGSEMLNPPLEQIPDHFSGSEMLDPPLEPIPGQLLEILDPPLEEILGQLLVSEMIDPPLEQIPDQLLGSEMLDPSLEQIPDQVFGSEMLAPPLEQIPDQLLGSEMLDPPLEQIPDQVLATKMFDPLAGQKMLDQIFNDDELACLRISKSQSVYARSFCRDRTNELTVAKCEQPLMVDPIHLTPVYDSNGVIYKNIFCAYCNGANKINFWKTKVSCNSNNKVNTLDLSPNVLYESLSKQSDCFQEYNIDNQNLFARPCFQTTHCTETSIYYQACINGGLAPVFTFNAERKSKQNVFKNEHCASCFGVDVACGLIDEAFNNDAYKATHRGIDENFSYGFTMDILPNGDTTFIVDDVTGGSTSLAMESKCSLQFECTIKKCPENYRIQDGNCVFNGSIVQVELHLQAYPETSGIQMFSSLIAKVHSISKKFSSIIPLFRLELMDQCCSNVNMEPWMVCSIQYKITVQLNNTMTSMERTAYFNEKKEALLFEITNFTNTPFVEVNIKTSAPPFNSGQHVSPAYSSSSKSMLELGTLVVILFSVMDSLTSYIG